MCTRPSSARGGYGLSSEMTENGLSVQPHTNASDTREPFLTGELLPGGHALTQVALTGPFLTGGLLPGGHPLTQVILTGPSLTGVP